MYIKKTFLTCHCHIYKLWLFKTENIPFHFFIWGQARRYVTITFYICVFYQYAALLEPETRLNETKILSKRTKAIKKRKEAPGGPKKIKKSKLKTVENMDEFESDQDDKLKVKQSLDSAVSRELKKSKRSMMEDAAKQLKEEFFCNYCEFSSLASLGVKVSSE